MTPTLTPGDAVATIINRIVEAYLDQRPDAQLGRSGARRRVFNALAGYHSVRALDLQALETARNLVDVVQSIRDHYDYYTGGLSGAIVPITEA